MESSIKQIQEWENELLVILSSMGLPEVNVNASHGNLIFLSNNMHLMCNVEHPGYRRAAALVGKLLIICQNRKRFV